MSNLKTSLHKQLTELNAQRDAIAARSAPLREERDRIVNEARAKAKPLTDQIKVIEKDLAALDTDRAMLARALGGKRMSDAANVR